MTSVLSLVRQTQALKQECCYRPGRPFGDDRPTPTAGMTIALEREVGTPASAVARKLGQRLGWPVYDHELVERLAEELHRSVGVLEALDEQPQGWWQERLASFEPDGGVSVNLYAHRLAHLIRSLAEQGQCIVVGRGAAQLLRPRTTLRVQLVGTWPDRVAAVGRDYHLEPRAAARKVAELSRARAQFMADHFRADPSLPEPYDLALNTSHWTIDQCADLILQALHNRDNA